MIGNPIVVKKSGGGQTYNITDSSGLGFPESAEAGAIVDTTSPIATSNGIQATDSNGNDIPAKAKKNGFVYRYYFVMPSSDVVVTWT